MPPKIKPAWRQADFLYDLTWHKKIDDAFIDYLAFEARCGNLIWPHQKNVPIVRAIDFVNDINNQEFSYAYGLKKLNLLEKRYTTFSWMLGLDHVAYVASTNVVTAPDDVWMNIFEVISATCLSITCAHDAIYILIFFFFVNPFMQEEPFSWAYLAEGEPKFEELSVIFARAVDDIVVVSSDEEGTNLPNELTGKEFILIDDEMPQQEEQRDMIVEPYAIVPYVEPVPLQSIPPLDTINISSTSTQTSVFNWWDYLACMSDDEGSTATESSTARSFKCPITQNRRRLRHHTSRDNGPVSPLKSGVLLSATASNSPLSKPRTK